MPGWSAPRRLASVACTCTFLVVWSTTESTAVTRPANAALFGCRQADAHLASDAHLAGILLRHTEIDVDRIELLQRDDRIAAVQVLAEVDLAYAEHA